MRRLFLVRHARPIVSDETPASEWDLDPAGLPALEALAALPLFASARRIVSSTERKALATAEAIRRAHPHLPPLQTYEDLGEHRRTVGLQPDFQQVMARLFAEPDRPALPGWESATAAVERFERALAAATAGEDEVIVVGHGTVLSLYLARLEGRAQVDLAAWRAIRLPDVAVVEEGRIVRRFGRST